MDFYFRKSIFAFLIAWLLLLAPPGESPAAVPAQGHSRNSAQNLIPLQQAYGNLPLAFEPNQGQTDPRVRFLARGSGYTFFVTSQEAVLSLKKPKPMDSSLPGKIIRSHDSTPPKPETGSPTILRLKLEGAQTNPAFENLEPLPGVSNYFIGKNPPQWRIHIPQYSKVAVHGLYPGIDMVYYGNQGKLEYDFVVQPGADPGAIHLKIEGAQSVQVAGQGDLELQTDQGNVILRAPAIYQEVGGQKNQLEGRYRLAEGNRIGFEVKDYDRAKPLVIDPVLDYSTYLGGTGYDAGNGIAVDASGDAFVTGQTESTGFPTTNGAAQTFYGGGTYGDAFVTELNPAGTAVIYSTFLGGNGQDVGAAIALDSSGDAYVTGFTNSPNFPTTGGAFQTVLTGSYSNAFVTELNPSGSALAYSTYLGGSYWDQGTGIVVDGSGKIYVSGYTESTNFPTSLGAYQTALTPYEDAFITKLNPAGGGTNDLVYSTYLGASNQLIAFAIAVDGSGNAYVTGQATAGFPTTPGAYYTASSGGINVYVTKLNPTGTALVYSTFLGPSGDSWGLSIAVDGSGNAYVAGNTTGGIATTAGAFQSAFGGLNDAFVTELNASGTALIYSTYLGGASNDWANGITVDGSGNAYVTGQTFSSDFPTTGGAYQGSLGGYWDAFLTELNPSGSALVYSTYMGGSGWDQSNAIAIDGSGNVYITGYTAAPFPTTTGAYQTSFAGSDDAFVAKFALSATNTPTPTATSTPSAPLSFCYSTQWGSYGTGNGQFGAPSGIGVDPNTGNVYVSDFSNDNVQEFTSTGTFITKWGTAGAGNGQFSAPNNLYVDSGGNVFVIEAGGNRAQEFTGGGTFLMKFGTAGTGTGQFNTPTGIWTDPSGNIYVAGGTNRAIEKFNSSGVFLTQWGSQGSGNGQFTWPVGVAVDPTGQYVYVADANANSRVQKFDINGTYLSQWGGPGTGNSQFSSPRGIATDCAGNVYVTDFSNPRVQVFDANGNYITQFGSSAQFSDPEAISVDKSGNVYVGDWTGAKVVKYSLCAGSFNCGATRTATFTPTATATWTPSFTATSTRTLTATFTVTNSPTLTTTPTPSLTPTVTATWTPSFTPTLTLTVTDTRTPTFTPTITYTPTITDTPTITFTPTATPVPEPYSVKVAVYNAAGELVKVLLAERFPQPVTSFTLSPGNSITSLTGPDSTVTLYWNGTLLAAWDGTNASGDPVSNGTYFVKVDCVDNLGTDQTVVQNVTVSRPLGQVAAEIYNAAGELVRTLYAAVGSGGPVTGVQLSSTVLQMGAAAQNPVTIGLSNGVTLSWDGSGAGGTLVTNGVYYLQIVSDNGTGVEEVITKELMVVNNGRASGGVIAYPNPWKDGDPPLTFQAFGSQPLTLKVWLYDLAGEKVALLEGTPGTGQVLLQNPTFASGLYIAVVEMSDANGNLTARQSLKVMIRH